MTPALCITERLGPPPMSKLADFAPPPAPIIIADPERLDWYVVETLLHGSFLAEGELRQRGMDAYCPRETVWRTSGRRKAHHSRPLLGRYLFLGMDTERQSFHTVRLTPGVGRVIGTDAPRCIPYRAVRAFRDAETLGNFDRTADPGLVWRKGCEGRIVSGAFAGRLVEGLSAPVNHRVSILLKGVESGWFGAAPASIDLDRLEKVSEPADE